MTGYIPQASDLENVKMFELWMEARTNCSLGQLTAAMVEVGGQYRRNMRTGAVAENPS